MNRLLSSSSSGGAASALAPGASGALGDVNEALADLPGDLVDPVGELSISRLRHVYQKKEHRDQILSNIDMYAGSNEMQSDVIYVVSADGKSMQQRSVASVPALVKIFDEAVVNAADDAERTRKYSSAPAKGRGGGGTTASKKQMRSVTRIEITIDAATGVVTVWNDGNGIPVFAHPDHDGLNSIEMLFGHLNTSQNYCKNKTTGGKNGYGIKLANLCSDWLEVETMDRISGIHYTQRFEDHMRVIGEATVAEDQWSAVAPFTRVSFKPDLPFFGMQRMDADLLAVLRRRAYDLSVCCGSRIAVVFNGEDVNCGKLTDYMKLYLPPSAPSVETTVNDRWRVGVALSDGGFRHVSFVNGVCTSKGGRHVEYVASQLYAKLAPLLEKKHKVRVPETCMRHCLHLFVEARIEDPMFDGQTKDRLTTPARRFEASELASTGTTCRLSDAFIQKVFAMGLAEKTLEYYQYRENSKADREAKKQISLSGILKLADANNAGHPTRAKNCTLIVTEGDSAKALAISGLSVVGRDNYGVFPLRGKLINPRETAGTKNVARSLKAANNQELNYLKRIINLDPNLTYETDDDMRTLRYHRMMIMADQDVDGSHIKGLVMNWIELMWPALLRRGFLSTMVTPIVRARKGAQVRSFYSIPEFEAWEQTAGRGWISKYYKGLGTSTAEEGREYFSDLKHMRFEYDDRAVNALTLAFDKSRADDRKAWIGTSNDGRILDPHAEEVTVSDFVDLELKLYSRYDVDRNIPSVFDGLKTSQRKIFHACSKKGLITTSRVVKLREMKVAQLAGYVAEKTAYHHGEQALTDTIVGMAQDFIGSNNVPLLVPIGQFGTRARGGKDKAASRYIHTAMHPMARALFPQADEAVLEYNSDDGVQIEPKTLVGVLPAILLNGVNGIGTGYSTRILSYNPLEIARQYGRVLADRLREKKRDPDYDEPPSFGPLTPWFRGFQGDVVSIAPSSAPDAEPKQFLTKGVYEILNTTTIEIRELPIEVWNETYKQFLQKLKDEGILSRFEDHCRQYNAHFVLHFKSPTTIAQWDKEPTRDKLVDNFEKHLKLTSKFSTTNMHVFVDDAIVKCANTSEINAHHFERRLQQYAIRKKHQLTHLKTRVDRLSNTIRFIDAVISKDLVPSDFDVDALNARLEADGYTRFTDHGGGRAAEGGDDDGRAGTFEYLLDIRVKSQTRDRLASLRREMQQAVDEFEALQNCPEEQIWLDEIDVFVHEYERFLQKCLDEEEKDRRAHAANNRRKKGGKKSRAPRSTTSRKKKPEATT